MTQSNQRLNPDALLDLIKKEDDDRHLGKLRVFLGMSAGVGKTYSMLKAAHQRQEEGLTVVIGAVEAHGRSETHALIEGLSTIKRKQSKYRDTVIEEMDLDAILKLKPDLVVVDELAHTNAPGSRHPKRYQDVIEILESGIDVYTAINVQHLESRKDSVEQITGISIRETVPDSILEKASQIELIDIAPSELLKRLREGKVYLGEKAEHAAENFFKEDKLTALREIALRITAERVDHDLQKFAVSRDEQPWQTNERLLVAVSHSPYSQNLIRATRRLAYNLEAPWIALHVETGLTLNDEDQRQLKKNLALARELKAEVINTTDTDVASAIKRISRQKNVTQVVVGKPTRRWFRDVIEGGHLLDRLVKDSQEVDVHVIKHDSNQLRKPSLTEELSLHRSGTGLLKYYYILWFFLGVTATGAIFEPYIGYRAVGFLFLLAVVITSLWGSIAAVLFSAVLSAFIWNFGFIPPRFTFDIQAPDDVILCISYFVAAFITGFLTNRIRIRENLIREREEKTNLMNQILNDISDSKDKSEFIEKVCLRISHSFTGEALVVLKSRAGILQFNRQKDVIGTDEKEQAVALWSFQNQKNAGWSTETLNQARALYIPLRGISELVGVLVYRPERKINRLSVDKTELLQSVATQLGISIERHFLSRRLHEAERLKDSETLHQTLLNSISHEMRTPLTAIMGATSAINHRSGQDEELKSISNNLSDASDRLNQVVENLLDMSRLNSGVLGLKLEWHDLSDLVGVVLKKMEKYLVDHKVSVQIDDEMELVEMDFRLFEHALSNLILNATQYAGKRCAILITARKINSIIEIVVADDGPGISDEFKTELFEKFYRVPGSPTGGTGLGLSIVKGIVNLHKGSIRCENRLPSGTRFVIEMPYSKSPGLKVQDKE